MKISKKILGVALAVIMIFNVFAVGTFAAVPADTVVNLMLRTDKTTYAPGEEITFTVSVDVIDDLTAMMVGGQYDIGYNGNAFELLSTLTAETGAPAAHGIVALQAGYDEGSSFVQIPSQGDISSLYDWTTAVTFGIVDDMATTYDARGGADAIQFKMRVKADAADGTYTIGFNPAGYESYNGYVNDGIGLGGLYGSVPDTSYMPFDEANMYAYGTCEIKVSSGPSVVVSHVGEQAKWKGGDANNTAENYLFGFIGQATGLTVETTENNGHQEVTNIQSIVATAAYNGTTVTSEVITMWAVDGGYQFRAVFSGFDPADTKDVSVTFAITMSDGTTTYATADASVDTPNAIYQAAVLRGMPALAA